MTTHGVSVTCALPRTGDGCLVRFGDDLCFNAIQVDVLAMRLQSGFVRHDGVTEALEGWHYDPTYSSSRFWPDEVQLLLKGEVRPRIFSFGGSRHPASPSLPKPKTTPFWSQLPERSTGGESKAPTGWSSSWSNCDECRRPSLD